MPVGATDEAMVRFFMASKWVRGALWRAGREIFEYQVARESAALAMGCLEFPLLLQYCASRRALNGKKNLTQTDS